MRLAFFLLFFLSFNLQAQFFLEKKTKKNEDTTEWILKDPKHTFSFELDPLILDPQILEIQTHPIAKGKLWELKLSSAPMGTSILTELEFLVLIYQTNPDSKLVTLAFEPIKISRTEGGKVKYQRKRDYRLDLSRKKLLLGALDEFSPKTIEIR